MNFDMNPADEDPHLDCRREIDRLEHDIACYEAMKEVFGVRIGDVEKLLAESELVASTVKAFIVGEFRLMHRDHRTGYHHRRMVLQLIQILKMPRPEYPRESP